MNIFQAILFDLDGVLVESYEAWFHLINSTAKHLGYPPVTLEIYRDIWGQGIQADIDCFYPGRTVAEIESYYLNHFRDYREHMILFPEGPEILTRLRKQNRKSAIITNTARLQALEILEMAGLEPDILVGGTDVPHSKPAPDMIHLACEKLEILPEQALVLGDSRFDREAARNAGVHFVGMGIEGDQTVDNLEEFDKRFVSIS